ncbi:hypothetical protein L227DRAFT_568703 [Lentinus tigrinus ALCF2SS1-6]|uniref:Uncharacterized protein n=1 Tax=Lentinus tigrinus ALCF2SS1-6 TaxID=1328759 RepID=A0A5C2RPY3_9APHY|nr:hypothetical protein L227DRAFT_568703 [Lentinus tigrinus ALCF2SS1-6]
MALLMILRSESSKGGTSESSHKVAEIQSHVILETSNLKLSQSHKRCTEAKRLQLQQISGLSFQDHDNVMAIDDDNDNGLAMHMLPPGEEGMFLSHKGGEDELCKAIFKDMPLPHKRHDP